MTDPANHPDPVTPATPEPVGVPPVAAPPVVAAPPPPPGPPAPPAPNRDRNYYGLAILILFGAVILILVARGDPVFDKLSDPAFARGLITFIICMATIGLAFMMVYQAFFSEESNDDKFRRAREIFAGLMGVLGTIVGFYFGSATIKAEAPQIATLQIEKREVVSYISGGTQPYRVAIKIKGEYSDAKEIDISDIFVSEDGWVRYSKFTGDISKAKVEIAVKDAQNIAADIDGEFKAKEAEPAPPVATPPNQS